MLDETQLQELFERYTKADTGSKEREKIIQVVGYYLYQYLFRSYNREEDEIADFYCDWSPSIQGVIEGYNPEYGVPFRGYLKMKTRRKFLNYLMKKRVESDMINQSDFYYLDETLPHKGSVFESAGDPMSQYSGELAREVSDVLDMLPDPENVIVRLYFGLPIEKKHVRMLVHQKLDKDFFRKIADYRSQVLDQRLQQSKERSKMVEYLFHLTYKIKTNSGSTLTVHKKERTVENFQKIRNPVPLRVVVELYGTNPSNVYRKLQSGLRLFREIVAGIEDPESPLKRQAAQFKKIA